MDPLREYFLGLAAHGLRMPIGTDLVLAEKPDAAAVKLDGKRLGEVIVESAQRWNTPLAMPLMDLTVEKEWLLGALGVPAAGIGAYHFHDSVPAAVPDAPPTPRLRANVEAIRHVAQQEDLLACGMTIGPFSLMTKLISDPITPVFMAGMNEQDAEVERLESALNLAAKTVLHLLEAQLAAGARAIIVCEPAANTTYFSPNQLANGADVFERYVITLNRHIAELLRSENAALIFHDCGELTDTMLGQFGLLKPVMLSLGSSRTLWEDAPHVPHDVVLYGNLPTKKFYSDEVMPLAQVRTKARELVTRMQTTGHPFILGSECDVLSVPGRERAIKTKVEAFLH
ncbi:MAG TPA: uroporphyrinogen decarboxylase family protein [Verrucomicrobiae bacterium]|nr:uroporphyrinogen decarboxylase family protein [Verrucomicrobiae bacterium]